MVGQLDGVERGSAGLGRRGGMRGRAVEPELHGDPRLAGDVAERVLARRMPVQDGVAIVEEVGSYHEGLGAAAFLGRTAVEPQRAFERPGADLLGQGQAR